MNFYKIKVKTKTWVRDSYGLFDYETKDIVRNQLLIEKKGVLVREGNEIKYINGEIDENEKDLNKLIGFSEENGIFFVIFSLLKGLILIFFLRCLFY